MSDVAPASQPAASPSARAGWADADVQALRSLGSLMRAPDFPVWLIQVMASESGCLPDPPHNGPARGLIQFEPATLKLLGWQGAPDAFAAQGVAQQLPFVARYFSSHAGKIRSLADTYVCNFLPACLGGGSTDILAAALGPRAWAYEANRGFDSDGKGWVTPQDLVNHALSAYSHSAVAKDLMLRLMALPDADGAPSL